jgi:hypothetical protein
MSEIEGIQVRYSGDPDYSRNNGYGEVKCSCGAWAELSLTHWDNDDETEYGEYYDIYCYECGQSTGNYDDEDQAFANWS